MEVKELARNIIEFYEKLSTWQHEVARGCDMTTDQIHAIEFIGHANSQLDLYV